MCGLLFAVFPLLGFAILVMPWMDGMGPPPRGWWLVAHLLPAVVALATSVEVVRGFFVDLDPTPDEFKNRKERSRKDVWVAVVFFVAFFLTLGVDFLWLEATGQ